MTGIGNKATLEIGNKAISASAETAQRILIATKMSGGAEPDAIYCIGAFIAGAASILAAVIADHTETIKKADGDIEKFNPDNSITEDLSLFAYLLAYRIAPSLGGRSIETSFGPGVTLDALNDFEKLTGRQIDSQLVPGMAQVAREAGAVGKDAFDAFLQARRNSPDVSTTLN